MNFKLFWHQLLLLLFIFWLIRPYACCKQQIPVVFFYWKTTFICEIGDLIPRERIPETVITVHHFQFGNVFACNLKKVKNVYLRASCSKSNESRECRILLCSSQTQWTEKNGFESCSWNLDSKYLTFKLGYIAML